MDDASVRALDADRDSTVAALTEHLLAGRLTLEEYSERVDTALRARVNGELARLQNDLPVVSWEPDAARPRPRARFAATAFSHVVRRGRLRLGPSALAVSFFGDLDFDLRDASIDRHLTTITVLGAFGNADLYVPEGVNVDVSGIPVFGHLTDRGRDVGRPDAPAIHIRMAGIFATACSSLFLVRSPVTVLGWAYGQGGTGPFTAAAVPGSASSLTCTGSRLPAAELPC